MHLPVPLIATVLLTSAHAAAAPAPASEVERNKAVIRRFVDECLNAPATAAAVLDEIVAPDMENVAAGKKGAPALKALVAALQREAPDQRYVIDALVAEGDMVVMRVTRTGTSQLTQFRRYPIAPGQAF